MTIGSTPNINEPIYLHAWGGQSTIARGLKSIEEQYRGTPQWSSIRAKVISKAVIHFSGDQDNTAANYIRPNWPEIRYGNGGGAPAAGAGASGGARGAAAAPGPAGPARAGAGRSASAGPRQPARFLRPLMHDLAGRMTWAVTPTYAGANHYPTVTLKNPRVSGRPGEMVTLSATTRDPDGDKVSVKWWRFDNNGTYAGAVTLHTADGPTTTFRIPADAKPGDTIHIIAEANDDGMLSLTRYARAVVTVK